jgi:hypothetical protein
MRREGSGRFLLDRNLVRAQACHPKFNWRKDLMAGGGREFGWSLEKADVAIRRLFQIAKQRA